MQILVIRDDVDENRSLGKLFLDGQVAMYTLEPPPAQLAPLCDHPAIPPGRYLVKISHSEHFNAMVPHVLDVPNRSMIEIHWGNVADDTHGCILVGLTREHASIELSRMAFNSLNPKIAAAQARNEDVWITLVNPAWQNEPKDAA